MKRKTNLLILLIVALVAVLVFSEPAVASADVGPKPSIDITLCNLGDGVCYGTILSENISTGPYSAYAPDKGMDKDFGNYDSNYYYDENYHNEEVERIWQVFVDYEDADGYYFLQIWWKLGGEDNFIKWGYHPPYSFKLLLYYPETNTFVTSGIYERYAFDSYYLVDMEGVDVTQGGTQLTLNKSYDYTWEIFSLLCRIVLTIAIEIALALLFRIKGRRALLTILITNVVTQIALNVALNLLCYFHGGLLLFFLYVPLEIAVTLVEAVTYLIALRKQNVPVWKSIAYAVVANVVSAFLGLFLAIFIPGLF